jgi:hypothetical protein
MRLSGRVKLVGLGTIAAGVAVGVAVVAPTVTQTPVASAATVLIDAAGVAAAQAPLPALSPGQYYYEKTVVLQSCSFDEDGDGADSSAQAVYLSPMTKQVWTASDGSGRVETSPDGSGHFQTSAEQAAWAASGKPNECIEPGDTSTTPPSALSEPGIPSLPSDPTTLGTLIAAGRVTDGGELTPNTGHCPSQNGGSAQVFSPGQVCSVSAQFDIVNNLLGLPEAPAKLGPVLYRILAQLPGVEIIGTETDGLGRSGTAIEDPSGGDVVVLNPTDGTLLETETLATTATSSSGVPTGTVLQSTTFGTVGVVSGNSVVPT